MTGRSDAGAAEEVLEEVLRLLNDVGNSSLVHNEMKFLSEQFASLQLLDATGAAEIKESSFPDCRCIDD
jgi:hypothetical protein